MAIVSTPTHTGNPLVNAGALAASSLAPGDTADEKWDIFQQGLSRFAGRLLELDPEGHSSEAASNTRKREIAGLLESHGRSFFDPILARPTPTRGSAPSG